MLHRAVTAARQMIEGGERDAVALARRMETEVARADLGRLDYAEVVDAKDLQPVRELRSGMRVVAAVAVYFGRARLIDNAIVEVR